MTPGAFKVRENNRNTTQINLGFFSGVLLLLIAGAILRSVIATRLDGFTIDEAYHIAAGVSYVRDFRINPEHPPLVKLWVGSFMARTGFRARALRPFSDKPMQTSVESRWKIHLHRE